jgi:hypothetical protein
MFIPKSDSLLKSFLISCFATSGHRAQIHAIGSRIATTSWNLEDASAIIAS